MVMPHESSPNESSPVERGKSILSRLSSPLTKRSAKLFDFEIQPEHPHKVFGPGDSVKGKIVLKVYKGLEITHLAVSLHGYARVFKHQCAPGERKNAPEQLINGKGSHGFEYFGNGLASLFQDELILCGSGFLKTQKYEFEFELQFPAQSLPSTINFERGAVNYMISATVTRPTAIAPTTNRTCKIEFKDRIDIESMYTPKSRAIYMEPMNRLGKVKKVKTSPSTGTQEGSTKTLSRQNTSQSVHTKPNAAPVQNPPHSPAPSEETVATTATASTQSLKEVEKEPSLRKPSNESAPKSSTTSNSAHTISATTEIRQHGALPGDFVPIRVKVEHTKAVRGIVIATLYRQSRIDMLPALPLANRAKENNKNKKPEYEDVYPKSKTGLGGLYFTNGAPNMAFRNDLNQATTMMVVDPDTKTADVNFRIRVPDDDKTIFPSMDNIPGGMISFTYHLEVVIDLTGKLGESRLLPSLTSNGPSFSKTADDGRSQLTHEWGSNILDTAPLRRTKNVATFDLPLTIGTKDSGRSRRAQEAQIQSQQAQSYHGNHNGSDQDPTQYNNGWHQNGHDHYDQHYDYYGYHTYDDSWYDAFGNPVYDPWYDYSRHQHHPPAPNAHHNYQQPGRYDVPPPQDEEHLDEKSRLRRQEELLLPSQPPEAEGSSSRNQALAPSAPVLSSDQTHLANSPQPSIPITISRASARSADTIVPDPLTPPPSLPENEGPSVTEDKQELERRRLAEQASAPPTEDDEEAGPSSQRPETQAPSAPVIDDEAEYIAQTLRQEGGESLPQYQR